MRRREKTENSQEVVLYKDISERDWYRYSSASDVYACRRTMLCLMNLETKSNVMQYGYDTQFDTPQFSASALAFYPQSLSDAFVECTKPDPRDRMPADELWLLIQKEVTAPPRRLRDLPMCAQKLEDDEVLRFRPDRYAVWAS